jgi:hypothetical protein
MSNAQVREVTDAHGAATDPATARTEPSHIHIPRPSRVGQAIISRRDGRDPMPVVELALEAAAAA